MSSAPSDDLGLPRSRRIRHGRDFRQIKTGGRRLACGSLLINWRWADGSSESRLGVSRLGVVTGRALGGATIRNRVRRLVREAFRLHQRELVRPVDLVVVARVSISGKSFQQVEADLLQAWRRAGLTPVVR